MGTILVLSMLAFVVGFFIAQSTSDREENGPNPAKNYQEMIQQMNKYRSSMGVEQVQTLEVQYRKKNGL